MSGGLDWQAVAAEVRRHMAATGVTVAGLSRSCGLSETTVRYIRKGTLVPNKSTLVALSAGLGLDGWHLWDIAEGRDPYPAYSTDDRLTRIQQRIVTLTAKVDWLIARQDR